MQGLERVHDCHNDPDVPTVQQMEGKSVRNGTCALMRDMKASVKMSCPYRRPGTALPTWGRMMLDVYSTGSLKRLARSPMESQPDSCSDRRHIRVAGS